MTQYLPPNLLALFAARDPLPFVSPYDKLPHEKKRPPYLGLSGFLTNFEDPKETPPPTRVETRDERKERKRKERQEQHAYKLEQDLAMWAPATLIPGDPANIPSGTSDPYKTLFIARINYDTSESKLRREFEVFGSIKKISVIHEKATGKPRGYAFIEYEHERDMHSAYKHADGKKIDGRRVLVDVERGRTVKGWRPRRLGGGLGGTRKGGPDENTRFSGRDDYSGAASDRGGFNDETPAVGGGGGGGAGGGGGRGGGGRERSRSRERSRRRDRSRSRERSERRRGGSRERDRRAVHSRSKDRDRRRRSEERGVPEEEEDLGRKDKKRGRRSRSRDRKRSRSPRDRKRSRRSRSRDRSRRSRDRRIKEESDVSLEPPFGDGGAGYNNDNSNGGGGGGGYPGAEGDYGEYTSMKIKQEPSYEGYPVPQVPMDQEQEVHDDEEQ